MHRLIILLVALFCANNIFAQNASISVPIDSISLQLQKRLKTDSIKNLKNAKRLQSALGNKNQKNVSREIDSLQGVTFNKIKIDSSSESMANHIRLQADSVKKGLTNRLDSVENSINPTIILNSGLAKVNGITDSIQYSKKLKRIQKGENAIVNLQSKSVEKLTSGESKVNEKLQLISANGGNLPGNINLVEKGSAILPTNGQPSDLSFSNSGLLANVPSNNIGVPRNELNLTNASIPGTPLSSDTKILGVNGNELGKVGNLKLNSPDFKNMTDKATTLQGDIKNVTQGDYEKVESVPREIESRAMKVGGFSDIQTEANTIKKYQDPDIAKEEALNKAKETVVNYFIGHEEQLKAAMEQVSKVKSKIPDPEGVIDIFKKHANALKGTPFKKRLIFGVTTQVQKSNFLMVDLNPYISYKISGRFLAGVGWNERYVFDKHVDNLTTQNKIHGVRTNINFKVRSNFWLKGEVESMYSKFSFNRSQLVINENNKRWIWSYFGGIKKDFQFSKSWYGNVQLLYNLHDPHNWSPYLSKFNVRMGFEHKLFVKK